MKILSHRVLRSAAILAPVLVLSYLLVAVFFVPQLLLFPHHREVGGVSLYSERPIPDAAAAVMARSSALLSASALFRPDEGFRPIFLTDGGWRWKLLSLGASHAFAVTRPSNDSVIVNRSDFQSDLVWRGSAIEGERSLAGVIAHERTHTLIRRRFGLFADSVYPRWVREGYCDFVAGSSSLSEPEAAKQRIARPGLPALFYHDAHRRVAAVLASNGGSVPDLFNGSLAAD